MRYVYRIEDSKTGFVFDGDDYGYFSAADALREMRSYRKYYKTFKDACVRRYPFYSAAESDDFQRVAAGNNIGFINPDEAETMPDMIYKIVTDDIYDPTQKYDHIFFNKISDARIARYDINSQCRDNVAYIVQTEILDINPDEYDSRYEFLVTINDDFYLIAPNWWATI